MRNLNRDTICLGYCDGLFKGLDKPIPFVPQVSGIYRSIFPQNAGQFDKLFSTGLASRGVDKTGGHAEGTAFKALGQKFLHLLHFF